VAQNVCCTELPGNGAIVDFGCFLGVTTFALAEGLTLNRTTAKQKQIHVYDFFIWNEGYEKWAKGTVVEGVISSCGTFLPEFLKRTQKWRD